MKILVLLAALFMAAPFAASAAKLKASATDAASSCSAVTKVAIRNSPDACCTRLMQCPELLSTFGMLRGKSSHRT